MYYKLILILLFSFSIVLGQEKTDSVILMQKDEITQSDSSYITDFLTEINDLRDSISSIKKTTSEIKDSNDLFTSILLGILTGVIASILTLVVHNLIIENRLINKFRYLEGKYEHLVNNEIKQDYITNIKYYKGGKLVFDTKTKYGNWNARIIMDTNIPNIGGGAFNYENKDEGGFMNISVKDENSIYIFPFTLTHREQKVDFYILKRVNV